MQAITEGDVVLEIAGAKVSISAKRLSQLWLADLMRRDIVQGAAMPIVLESLNTPPAIGEVWPGQGGRYAGMSLTDDGLHACHLILPDADGGDLNHLSAEEYAAALEADGHKDFTVPNRVDGIVLFRNMKAQIGDVVIWLKEPSDSGYAWSQNFNDGDQSWDRKYGQLRARPVRRLII